MPSVSAGDTNTDTKLCSLHFKKRSVRNLVEDGLGGYRCQPGSECQTGGGKGRQKGDAAGNAMAAVVAGSAGGGKGMQPGDWVCPGCFDHQFARNTQCRKCSTPRPPGFGPVPKGEG